MMTRKALVRWAEVKRKRHVMAVRRVAATLVGGASLVVAGFLLVVFMPPLLAPYNLVLSMLLISAGGLFVSSGMTAAEQTPAVRSVDEIIDDLYQPESRTLVRGSQSDRTDRTDLLTPADEREELLRAG